MEAKSEESKDGVLLIEDDRLVQQVIDHHLSSRGYRVWVASDPVEARRLMDLNAESIRLLIVDSGLPVQSGESIAQELRSRFDRARVLMISGYPQPDPPPLDAHPFLQKPFSGEELVKKVEELLAQ